MKRERQIFLIDIGNTSTHIGVLEDGRIIKDFRIKTRKILKRKIDFAVLCSVSPKTTKKWIEYFKKRKIDFIEFKPENYPFKVNYSLKQIGSDRLANCLGVYGYYRFPAIIVDSGTATTVELVDRNGTYLGGAIFPGIEISKEIIIQKAEKIKNVEFKECKSFIGKNTEEALFSGIIAETVGGVEFLIKRYKKILKN
ncbi:MAG: hypothetical protein DRI36_01545, partial [Caldiserica bacterium]